MAKSSEIEPTKADLARKKRGQDLIRTSTLPQAGKALPGFPTTPDELAGAWDVGAEDTYALMVKVTRPCGGTVELVADIPLRNFNAGELAGKFGPGLYYMRAGAGKYSSRATKMIFSEDYARSNGFGTVAQPIQTAADLQAETVIRRAADGPSDPVAIMAAFERFYERKKAEERPQNLQATDPMAMMQSQVAQMMALMDMMRSVEDRAIKTVEMRMGIAKPEGTVEDMDTNSSIMEKLLLKGLEVFGPVLANAMTPKQNAVPFQPPQPPQPIQPALQDAQPTQPAQPEVAMPTLDDSEKKAIAGAVSMLRPFADHLIQMEASTLTDEQIVENLDPFVPEAMIQSLTDLSDVVAKRGVAVLGAIHPGLVKDRWGGILVKLVAKVTE